jgi:hypothetical protein
MAQAMRAVLMAIATVTSASRSNLRSGGIVYAVKLQARHFANAAAKKSTRRSAKGRVKPL